MGQPSAVCASGREGQCKRTRVVCHCLIRTHIIQNISDVSHINFLILSPIGLKNLASTLRRRFLERLLSTRKAEETSHTKSSMATILHGNQKDTESAHAPTGTVSRIRNANLEVPGTEVKEPSGRNKNEFQFDLAHGFDLL